MSGKNVDNFLDTMVYGEVGDWTHSTPNGYERNVEIKLGWGDRESTPGLFATHLSSLLSDHALPLNFPPWTSWPSSSPSNHRHFTQAGPPTCLNNSPFENLVDLSSISTSCKKPCLVKSFCYNLLSHQAAFLQRTFQNISATVTTKDNGEGLEAGINNFIFYLMWKNTDALHATAWHGNEIIWHQISASWKWYIHHALSLC